MDGGDSTFQLSNSGLFYFISGNLNNCKNGCAAAGKHPATAEDSGNRFDFSGTDTDDGQIGFREGI
ncbi:hypothetical protein JHK87_016748 [Glycine soja]|nr:hypothetical protein JHK87_016748 [Glycine soja]